MKASIPFRVGPAALLALGFLAAPVPVSPVMAATELVMYTMDSCPFCRRFEREVAPVYARTREGSRAPLRRVELRAGGVSGPELKEPVIATPTFVLMSDGREAGRITGYLNDDMFWGLLGRLVAGIDAVSDIKKRSGVEGP